MSLWVDAFAHDVYPDERTFQAFSLRDRPIMKLLEQKKHSGEGRTMGYPVLSQAAIAQGTTRADVQEQIQVAQAEFDGEEFVLGYFNPGYKSGFLLDDFNMALTQSSKGVPSGAYLDELTVKMQSTGDEFGQRQELYFIGRSGRSLAVSDVDDGASTDLGTGLFVCAETGQIANLRLGQLIQFSLADGSGSSDALISAQKFRVTGLDMDNSSFTFVAQGSFSLGDLDSAAVGVAVFVFNASDFQGNSQTKLPPGYQEWNTLVKATGVFQSVDRTNNSRLSGFRVNMTGITAVDAAIDKGLEDARVLHGASGTYTVAVGSKRWTQLMQLGEAKGYRLMDGQTVIGGYEGLSYRHGSMKAVVIDVPSMGDNDMFFMKMDGWCVRHAGGWPRSLPGDGLKCLRQNANDDYEYRVASYYHYGCRNINHQGRADLSGISF